MLTQRYSILDATFTTRFTCDNLSDARFYYDLLRSTSPEKAALLLDNGTVCYAVGRCALALDGATVVDVDAGIYR